MKHYDVAIIGAGFGGLGAALELVERGKSVCLFERLTYPGGCASTFTRRGYRFESGATLFSGFGEGQLFDRILEKWDLDVQFVPLDPVVEMRLGELEFDIPADRETFVDRLVAHCDDEASVRRFFGFQEEIADILWSVLDRPDLLPPLSWKAMGEHARRTFDYARLVRWLGRPLTHVLKHFGVEKEATLRNYLDAVCQITVQAPANQAEALFALGATDYFFRGTGHIHGGIGSLADALVEVVEGAGSTVSFADEVRGLERVDDLWKVVTRRGEITADSVVANLLPNVLESIVEPENARSGRLEKLTSKVKGGWGAAMLYLALDEAAEFADGPFHLELVDDTEDDFTHGNHVFVSVCGRDEAAFRSDDGRRTATVSTHFDLRQLRGLSDDEKAEFVDGVHARMRQTIRKRAPWVLDAVHLEMTASPRTWQRFTARPNGLVGGVPRDASLTHYLGLSPSTYAPDLWLVGDSIFPGQSVLATFVGGQCTARAFAKS